MALSRESLSVSGPLAVLGSIHAALLWARPDLLCLWTDELIGPRFLERAPGDVLAPVRAGDCHPPGFHAVLMAWAWVFGGHEAALRALASLVGTGAFACVAGMLARILPRRAAFLGACLYATSPLVVMYLRVVRYYGLFLLLAAASTWAFARLLDRRPRAGPVYAAVTLAMLHTEMVGLLAVAAHALAAPGTWPEAAPRAQGAGSPPGRTRSALAWIGLVVAGCLPFLWVYVEGMRQIERTAGALAPGPQAVGVRLVYPLYGLTLGETIYPWDPLVLPGALAWVVLATALGRSIRNWPRARLLALLFGLSWIVLPFYLAFCLPFNPAPTVGRLLLFAAPAFYGLAGLALDARGPLVRGVLVAAIVLLQGAGLCRYFSLTSYHNPALTIPWRAVVERLRTVPDAVVIAFSEPSLDHYAAGKLPVVNAGSFPGTAEYRRALAAAKRRTFVVLRQRGEIGAYRTARRFEDDLARAGLVLVERARWVALEPEYCAWLRWAGLPGDPWLVTIDLWEAPGSPGSGRPSPPGARPSDRP